MQIRPASLYQRPEAFRETLQTNLIVHVHNVRPSIRCELLEASNCQGQKLEQYNLFISRILKQKLHYRAGLND